MRLTGQRNTHSVLFLISLPLVAFICLVYCGVLLLYLFLLVGAIMLSLVVALISGLVGKSVDFFTPRRRLR
jgi:hypothetical protein